MKTKNFVHACYCVDTLSLRGMHIGGHAAA